MTLADLVAASATQLEAARLVFGHGTSNAHDEAAWLVLWSLGLPLDSTLDDPAELSASACQKAQALVAERIRTRKPAPYLTHEAWLQGYAFYVDERAIVPRSLLAEILVDGSVDYWLGPHTQNVLDLCTGNGSLGIIATQVWPEVTVLGVDISPEALQVAHINVARYALQDRMALRASDGLAAVRERFDLVLCNPPYVNAHSMALLPAEFAAEPALALDGNRAGGSDGMDFLRAVLPALPDHMSDQAVLLLEVGHERAHFESAFPGLHGVWLQTSAGEDQVVLLTRQALLP